MFKANNKQLETINKRWNDIRDYPVLGIDYQGEGKEVDTFTIDDNGKITLSGDTWYLNGQYALRCRYFERHPKLTKVELDYLLGNTNTL